MDYVSRYTPKILQNNDTMTSMYEVEGTEIEKIHGSLREVINNLFISTSDINGIQRFEKFYNIKPNALHTLEERRGIVLNKILYRPPFTRQRLSEILENVWGKGNYVYELLPDEYKLIIDINTNNPIIYLQFSDILRGIIPANIYLVLNIQYTYLYLKRNFTYNKLKSDGFTYGELSKYSTQNISD